MVNLTRNDILRTTMTEINMRLQGLSNPEITSLPNDLDSDGNISLATSEPPLENTTPYHFHDYANMSRPSSAHVQSFVENENYQVKQDDSKSSRGSSEKNLSLEFRSLIDMTQKSEPTLDMKASSVENLSNFGKEPTEYDARFPEEPGQSGRNLRHFLSEPTEEPKTYKENTHKQVMVSQAKVKDRVDGSDETGPAYSDEACNPTYLNVSDQSLNLQTKEEQPVRVGPRKSRRNRDKGNTGGSLADAIKTRKQDQ